MAGTAAAKTDAEGEEEKSGQRRTKSGAEVEWIIFRESFDSITFRLESSIQSCTQPKAELSVKDRASESCA